MQGVYGFLYISFLIPKLASAHDLCEYKISLFALDPYTVFLAMLLFLFVFGLIFYETALYINIIDPELQYIFMRDFRLPRA